MFKLEFLPIFFVYALTFSVCAADIYSKFHQNEYKVEFQRIELVSYEKSAWNFFDVKTFKFNRTCPLVNFTLNAKKDLGTELEVIVQIYKFLSNEYRIFPARFQLNVCKSINQNIAGAGNVYKCGNLTSCEIRKGITYKVCNFYLDELFFPPLFPNGEFKARCEFVNNQEPMFMADFFMRVYRPVIK